MDLSKNLVKKLYYKNGLSTREVGTKLGSPGWRIIRFMKENRLPRRSQAEINSLAFLASPSSFKVKNHLTNREKQLKTAGLMLYWGEGAKTTDKTIDLANSDYLMIQLFLKMLRKIYGIKEGKLRALLYCYKNQNIKRLINYWSKITGISEKQFTKPYIRKDFLEKKKNKMPYGLIHIRYNDKKLVNLIRKDTEKIIKSFAGVAE